MRVAWEIGDFCLYDNQRWYIRDIRINHICLARVADLYWSKSVLLTHFDATAEWLP
jgi:hypothetical protein